MDQLEPHGPDRAMGFVCIDNFQSTAFGFCMSNFQISRIIQNVQHAWLLFNRKCWASPFTRCPVTFRAYPFFPHQSRSGPPKEQKLQRHRGSLKDFLRNLGNMYHGNNQRREFLCGQTSAIAVELFFFFAQKILEGI